MPLFKRTNQNTKEVEGGVIKFTFALAGELSGSSIVRGTRVRILVSPRTAPSLRSGAALDNTQNPHSGYLSLYYFRVIPRARPAPGAPPAPRNIYDYEALTNWRNASPWYPARTMAVENEPPSYMQPPRRVMRPRRGYTHNALIAWLDEQERLIRRRGVV